MQRPARIQLTIEDFNDAVEEIRQVLYRKLEKKGLGAAYSEHEVFGLLEEEVDEALDELKANNMVKFKRELCDIAVCCILGVASL